jgi:hypothetical protein
MDQNSPTRDDSRLRLIDQIRQHAYLQVTRLLAVIVAVLLHKLFTLLGEGGLRHKAQARQLENRDNGQIQ